MNKSVGQINSFQSLFGQFTISNSFCFYCLPNGTLGIIGSSIQFNKGTNRQMKLNLFCSSNIVVVKLPLKSASDRIQGCLFLYEPNATIN